MEKFDSLKGLIHFVFANEEDIYYLPSLVRLGFQRYLYYCIKCAGYKHVFFVSSSQNGILLEYLDGESRGYYKKHMETGFLKKLLPRKEDCGMECRESVFLERKVFLERCFFSFLEEKGRTAVVFPVETFDYLLQDEESRRMIFEINRKKSADKNIIVLVCPLHAGSSKYYFMKPDGIFQTELFPEFQYIAKQGRLVHFYDKLAQYLEQRCQFLNLLEREDIYSIMLSHVLLGNGEEEIQELEDETDFIYAWYHSAALQKAAEGLLPDNEKRLRSTIAASIENPLTLDGIKEWITRQGLRERPDGKSLLDILKERYSFDRKKSYMYSDHYLLRKMRQIQIPDTMPDVSPLRVMEWRNQMWSLQEDTLALLLGADESRESGKLNDCLDIMQDALDDRDGATFEQALEAMKFVLAVDYEAMPEKDTVWDFYRAILELSKKCFSLENHISDYTKRITGLRKKIRDQREAIETAMKRDRMLGNELEALKQGILAEPSAEVVAISMKMQETVELKRDMDVLQKVCSSRQKQMLQYRGSIKKLQHTIDICRSGMTHDLSDVLEKAMEMMEQTMKAEQENQRKLEEIPERPGYSAEEILTDSTLNLENIEREYEKLLESGGF